jgi:hypothetical protein
VPCLTFNLFLVPFSQKTDAAAWLPFSRQGTVRNQIVMLLKNKEVAEYQSLPLLLTF